MAEYGQYSSIPDTSGMGQGGAQVFQPQVAPLSAAGLASGIANAGQGIAAGMYEKQRREDEEAKKKAAEEAAKNAEVQKVLNGEYTYTNDAKRILAEQGYEKMVNATTDAERDVARQELLSGLKDIGVAESLIKEGAAKHYLSDENSRVYDPEFGYGTGKEHFAGLASRPLNESETELLRSNPKAFITQMQDSFIAPDREIIIDPKANVDAEIIGEFGKWTNAGGASTETLQGIKTVGDLNVTTLRKAIPASEYENFRQFIKDQKPENSALRQNWEKSYALENNLSPATVRNNREAMDKAWAEKVDSLLLPKKETIDIQVTNRPADAAANGFRIIPQSGEKANEVLTTNIKQADEALKTIQSDIKKTLPELQAKLDKAKDADVKESIKKEIEDKKTALYNAQKDLEKARKDSERASEICSGPFTGAAIVPNKAGGKMPEVDIEGSKGELSFIGYNDKNEGFAIINTPIAYRESASEGESQDGERQGVSQSASMKQTIPSFVFLNQDEITKLAERYQVPLTTQTSAPKAQSRTYNGNSYTLTELKAMAKAAGKTEKEAEALWQTMK